MTVDEILNLIFGAGGTGLIALLIKLFQDAKKGRLEKSAAAQAKVESDMEKLEGRAELAESRLDEAEEELRQNGKIRRQLLEYITILRTYIMGKGLEPPAPPEEVRLPGDS